MLLRNNYIVASHHFTTEGFSFALYIFKTYYIAVNTSEYFNLLLPLFVIECDKEFIGSNFPTTLYYKKSDEKSLKITGRVASYDIII